MGSFRLELIDAPAEEPITTAEAKTHSKIEDSAEDTLIGLYITAARERAEQYTRRAIITQQWKMYLDTFPSGCIELPFPKLQTVDLITYYDTNGAQQTLDDSLYETESIGAPGHVKPIHGQVWPYTAIKTNAVEITFTAGYGDAAAVPEAIKLAIKFLVAHWYENREPTSPGVPVTEIPKTFEWILTPFRCMRLG